MKIIANFPLADGKALRIEGSSRLKKRGLMDVPHVIKALKENKPLSTILEMTSNG